MVLVFDVWSDLAMFRKPYTTTSQVSFPFPPPTAVAGLVSAIVGLGHGAEKEASNAAYWGSMAESQIGIGFINRIQYYSTTINLLKFKSRNGDMGEHIQSKHQMLKTPRFRIYFQGGQLYSQLKKRLENKEFVFTPCLGAAYALADISYIGEFEAMDINEIETWVDTVVPLYDGVQLDVMRGRGLHRERVPFQMNSNRELIKTVSVVYPEIVSRTSETIEQSRRIWLKNRGSVTVSQVGEDRVSWFEKW